MNYTPYQSHSPTSEHAASLIEPQTLKSKVFLYIVECGRDGATDDEIQVRLDMNPSTQRPRRVDLVREGFVTDSGRKRKTRGNRNAVVWVLTKYTKTEPAVQQDLFGMQAEYE